MPKQYVFPGFFFYFGFSCLWQDALWRLICGLFSVAFLYPLREGRRVLWYPRLRGRLCSQAKSKRFLQSTVQLQLTEKNLSLRAFQREKGTQGLWRKRVKNTRELFPGTRKKMSWHILRGVGLWPPGEPRDLGSLESEHWLGLPAWHDPHTPGYPQQDLDSRNLNRNYSGPQTVYWALSKKLRVCLTLVRRLEVRLVQTRENDVILVVQQVWRKIPTYYLPNFPKWIHITFTIRKQIDNIFYLTTSE